MSLMPIFDEAGPGYGIGSKGGQTSLSSKELITSSLLLKQKEEDDTLQHSASTDTTLEPHWSSEYLTQLVPLGTPGFPSRAIREYDLSRILPKKVLEAHGKDGEGRYLLYPREQENVQDFWQELRREIHTQSDKETLLVRLDRVSLKVETVADLARTLFFRDYPGGRLTLGKRVLLVNPDHCTQDALYYVMEKENDMCLVLEAKDTTQPATWKLWYVGKFQSNLRTIIDFIADREETTARDIAQHHKFVVNGVQTRLAELFEDGLVKRVPTVSGAKKPAYGYTFFHPALEFLPDARPQDFTYSVYNPAALERAQAFEDAIQAAKKNNRLGQARAYSTRLIELYTELGDQHGLATALWNAGSVERTEKKWEAAWKFYQQSFDQWQKLDDKPGMAQAYHSMGVATAESGGDPNLALSYYQQSLDIRQEMGLPASSVTLNNMATVLAFMGRHEEAHERSTESLRMRVDADNLYDIGGSLSTFTMLAARRQAWKRVAVLSGIVEAWYERIGNPYPSHAQEEFNGYRTNSEEALGRRMFEAAVAKGRALRPHEAIRFATSYRAGS